MNDTPSPAPAKAGWYPHPGGQYNTQMYWDGAAWRTDQVRPDMGDLPAGVAVPAQKRSLIPKSTKGKVIAGTVAGVLLIGVIGSLANGGNRDDEPTRAAASPTVETVEEEPVVEEEPDTRVTMPQITGLTVAEAVAALAAINVTLQLPAEVGQDWIVTSQTIAGGAKFEPGDPLSIGAEAPKPVYTLAQENAIRKAQSYLDYSGFSRQGLIEQLEYEGFSPEDSTFAADNAGADWNAECAEKATSYMKYSAFSRDGLADQLAYEQFTPEQIAVGLAAVGY